MMCKAFQDVEAQYSKVEKLALALVTTARWRRLYVMAYKIIVLTNEPLKKVSRRPDVVERLVG